MLNSNFWFNTRAYLFDDLKRTLIASPFNQPSILIHSIQDRGNKYGNWIAFPFFEREPEKAIYYDILHPDRCVWGPYYCSIASNMLTLIFFKKINIVLILTLQPLKNISNWKKPGVNSPKVEPPFCVVRTWEEVVKVSVALNLWWRQFGGTAVSNVHILTLRAHSNFFPHIFLIRLGMIS